jgi:hypothetical protein
MRLRAEAAAQLHREGEAAAAAAVATEENEAGFWDDEEPEPTNPQTEHRMHDDQPVQTLASAGSSVAVSQSQPAPSSKKKGKKSTKKTNGKSYSDDEAEIPEQLARPKNQSRTNDDKTASAAWVTVVLSRTFKESVLVGLFSPTEWAPAKDDDVAEARLAKLVQCLSLASPLGMAMPLGWSGFLRLEVDFGPKRTSRRAETPYLDRLQKNIGDLLPFYITAAFLFLVLHSLANFEFFFLVVAGQAALVVAPPVVAERLPPPARIMALQVTHLLLWLFFVRSLWMTHLLIKLFSIAVVCAHACAVAPVASE